MSSVVLGENLDAAVAGVHRPFPWLEALREVSPVTEAHSFLVPYWYEAKQRWVLYDVVPLALLDTDAPVALGTTGREMIALLQGPPPRLLEDWQINPVVSDVQHEMFQVYRGYARPFWILQGSTGGHQVSFDPWQQNVLKAKRLPENPPPIGVLPPCPFDQRAITQLHRLNRLRELGGSLERLRQSGTAEAQASKMDAIQREIRAADIPFLEAQMEEVAGLLKMIHARADGQGLIGTEGDGQSALADEGLAAYIETGEFLH